MRVGVYVDAFNVYYGARRSCGRGTAGWRWLDLHSLSAALISERRSWAGAGIATIVYCTARIDAADNPSGYLDQDVYLKALEASGAVDVIELGHYVARSKQVPLARQPRKGRPQIVRPDGPLPSSLPLDIGTDSSGQQVVLATGLVREEKGSDVNVATHLLVDVLSGKLDTAIVISNDSDLRLPIQIARKYVPVGTINPGPGYLAGALQGSATEGAGGHWWRQLGVSDFVGHQLPDPAGGYRRPSGW
jgi:hypothetical protein